jgi:biotin carboxylase
LLVEVENIFDPAELFHQVEFVHRRHPLSCVVPLLENTVVATSTIAAALGLVHCCTSAVSTARNKGQTRQRLASVGLTPIRFAVIRSNADIESAAARVGFPLFFKPTTAAGSLFATSLQSLSELKAKYDEFRSEAERYDAFWDAPIRNEVIVEEVLAGTLVSAEVAASRGENWVMAIGERKRWSQNDSIELGTSMPPRTLSASQVLECARYARRVVSCLGLDNGIFHIEIMYRPSGPCLVEANPRLMGGNGPYLLSEHLGVDVCDLLIDLFEGKNPAFPADFPGSVCVMSHFLASTVDLKPSYDESALSFTREFRNNLISFSLDLKSGAPVRAVTSNYDYFGKFQMRAETPQEADRLVAEFHRRLSEVLKVPLAY